MTRLIGPYSSLIYAALRIITGMMYWMHGTTKVFGFPPGARRPLADLHSLIGVAGILECVLGVFIIVGLFGSYAAFIASGEMAFAYFIAQFPYAVLPIYPAPGILAESAVFNCFFFLYIASRGSGPLSLDHLWESRRQSARRSAAAADVAV